MLRTAQLGRYRSDAGLLRFFKSKNLTVTPVIHANLPRSADACHLPARNIDDNELVSLPAGTFTGMGGPSFTL